MDNEREEAFNQCVEFGLNTVASAVALTGGAVAEMFSPGSFSKTLQFTKETIWGQRSARVDSPKHGVEEAVVKSDEEYRNALLKVQQELDAELDRMQRQVEADLAELKRLGIDYERATNGGLTFAHVVLGTVCGTDTVFEVLDMESADVPKRVAVENMLLEKTAELLEKLTSWSLLKQRIRDYAEVLKGQLRSDSDSALRQETDRAFRLVRGSGLDESDLALGIDCVFIAARDGVDVAAHAFGRETDLRSEEGRKRFYHDLIMDSQRIVAAIKEDGNFLKDRILKMINQLDGELSAGISR